jgi:PhoH-like ATPase
MIKDYILDTNVLLHDCQSIFNFDDNNVIIPMTVIEELDNFKKESNELGRNARHFSNSIDSLRELGSLIEGVGVGKGTLRVGFCRKDALDLLPSEMDQRLADNKILAITLFNQRHSPFPTVLISNDTNLRIKADALGLTAQAYENGKVNFDTLYTGITDTIADPLYPNQYVQFLDAEGSVERNARYDLELNRLVPLKADLESWGLNPANEEQRCAMDMLLNDDIKLVTLVGKAGTGKTLLSLACALRKVTDDYAYKKVLVSRPIMPMGKDIGYLPGDISEKYAPYLQPIADNVEYLMSGYKPTGSAKGKGKKKCKDELEKEEGLMPKGYQELVAAGIMELEPLLYIRGRSIPDVIMIVDECQSLTPHEIKTIVTRAGVGTKLIFTGDPDQIDNPYLDASSNGLTYLVEKMKDQKIAGHVTLTQGERSELAEIASNIL